MQIITRQEAVIQNLSHYFTGKPCKYNHIAKRYVRNATCIDCKKMQAVLWRANNPEQAKEKSKKDSRKWRAANPEKWKIQSNKANRKRYTIDSQKIKDRNNQWHKNNPAKIRSRNARKRIKKLQRSVKWADQQKIADIYANCPQGYHVDHIIPLQGKLVSGLHNEFNLQYLLGSENCAKKNKFQPYSSLTGII